MKNVKMLLAGVSLLGIFSSNALAQIVREDHVDPAMISPADPKNLPAQSPGARTSAGAIVISYKVNIIDRDQDGLVSRAEVVSINMPELLKVFDKLDRNRDGKLEQKELDRFVK